MKHTPLVSVIIPVYNAEQYIAVALDSIVRQTYKNLEILICDDASTDGSGQIIKTVDDARIRLFQNETNRGYLRTINLLVSHAEGDFLCFQDADDVSHPERIRMQVEALQANLALGFVGTNYAMISPRGRILREMIVETRPLVLQKALESGNPFQKPSIIFRREVYKKIGMYREQFLQLGNISEDFDWILRVSEHFEVGNINGQYPLYFYRSVASAMSKNVKSMDQLAGQEVAIRLYRERKSGQKDSIERGDLTSVMNLIAELRKPYELSKSLFHQKMAASFMYVGLYRSAIWEALNAVMKEPLKFSNYVLLQYCIRKTLLGF